MTQWSNCKLRDLLDVKHGYAFLGEYFGTAGSHIVVTPGSFYDEGGFKDKGEKEKWYSGPVPGDYILSAGDLIIAMTEQAEGLLGSGALIPCNDIYLHNQRIGLIQIRDPKKIDKRFLYYTFNSTPVRQQIRASASGTKIRHTAPSRIGDVTVCIPPLPIQKRIASILSAYDELIENSQRRIRILETMARSLYREWFVHFRFPGHEKVPLVPSPLGKIPKGWEAKTISDLTSYLGRGISPIYDENGSSLVINQKCIREQRISLEPARLQSKSIPLEKRIKFGDVLINSTGVGTLGRVAQIYESVEHLTVDSHVTIARADQSIDIDYFGCTLLGHQASFERLGVGATGQTELSRVAIGNIEIVVPPSVIQQRFGGTVRPIRSLINSLTTKVINLRRTRDLLLPRLLSGQVDVGQT